jgi:SMODS-associating 2TM, beta-strand rich effector domain
VRADHEYSVVGHSRAVIGRYIAGIAAAIASLAVLGVGAALNLAEMFGVRDMLPEIVLWPLSAGAVWAVIYAIFNTTVWRWPFISQLMKVPNLSGEWIVDGQTVDHDQNPTFKWSGTLTIVQTWEKIRVCLKTAQSSSTSLSASVFYEPGEGYRLTYNYRNDPKADQKELRTHVGFADLVFNTDLNAALGDYFNNKGRVTQGVMRLTKKVKS